MNVKRRSTRRRILQALSSPRSVSQLIRLTQLPERTLMYHLAVLRREGLLREIVLFSDRRRKIFTLLKKPKNPNVLLAVPVKDYILGILSKVEIMQ